MKSEISLEQIRTEICRRSNSVKNLFYREIRVSLVYPSYDEELFWDSRENMDLSARGLSVSGQVHLFRDCQIKK